MNMETKDLILGKAKFEDWESMYRNVWSRPETGKYMLWRVTADEAGAKERMQRSIAWQKDHDVWMVYERSSGQAIGFAGVEEIKPHIWQDASLALGPDYVGKGYGKQLLQLLLEYCASLAARNFIIPPGCATRHQGRWRCPAGLLISIRSRGQTPAPGSPMNWKYTGKPCRRRLKRGGRLTGIGSVISS